MSSNLLNPLVSINTELADRLEHDEAFQRRYIRAWTQTEVASEIRSLRKTRRKNQRQVAELIGTGQSAISRIEKADYDGWTYKTLITIAERLKARLRITFEPIEDVARGYRGRTAGETFEGIAEEGTARKTALASGVATYATAQARSVTAASTFYLGTSVNSGGI